MNESGASGIWDFGTSVCLVLVTVIVIIAVVTYFSLKCSCDFVILYNKIILPVFSGWLKAFHIFLLYFSIFILLLPKAPDNISAF